MAEEAKMQEGQKAEDGVKDPRTEADQKEKAPEEAKPSEAEKKYSDEDVDRIIEKKLKKWEKQHEKDVSEAERLANMSAEEQIKELQSKIDELQKKDERQEMAKTARSMLKEKDIDVEDDLLAMLVAEDADATKDAVESFIELFNKAVSSAVKNQLKGNAPESGGQSSMTKEQILKVADKQQRQKLMAENKGLFTK